MDEETKKAVKNILLFYLDNKVFTGCALGVSCLGQESTLREKFYLGKVDKKKGSLPVDEKSFFDAASLTKPLVTVLSVLALVKKGVIRFEDTLHVLLSQYIPVDKQKIRLVDLLCHTSGLPSHRSYFKTLIKLNKKERKKNITKLILGEKLESTPGKIYNYSDLDYILLGQIIELKSGKKLDDFWVEKITDPLRISHNFRFYERNKSQRESKFVITGACPWSMKRLDGLVHDDNCRVLGSMSGHAGLFSTLDGVLLLCENLLLQHCGKENHPSFNKKDLLALFPSKRKKKNFVAFDTPSSKGSSSGNYFTGNSIGHLGYTGTSFWIDLERRIIIVLLTNRVIFGNDNKKIKKMRPAVHNLIMSVLNCKIVRE